MTGAVQELCAELGLALAASQVEALGRYIDLLHRWNGTYNLTAVRAQQGMVTQHLADCLAIVSSLRRQLGAGSQRLLDVGSGGGLPGAILAICEPTWDVCCVDAVAKKVAFVRQTSGELTLPNLHAVHGRIETVTLACSDLVISRAFASLHDFVALTRPHLATRGVWVAMKGKIPMDEISGLPSDVEVFHVEPIQVPGMNADRCLIWMRQKLLPEND